MLDDTALEVKSLTVVVVMARTGEGSGRGTVEAEESGAVVLDVGARPTSWNGDVDVSVARRAGAEVWLASL
jgi:hypothetical protein